MFRGGKESPDSRQITSGNNVFRDKRSGKPIPFRFSTLNNFCLAETVLVLKAVEISNVLLKKRFGG